MMDAILSSQLNCISAALMLILEDTDRKETAEWRDLDRLVHPWNYTREALQEKYKSQSPKKTLTK